MKVRVRSEELDKRAFDEMFSGLQEQWRQDPYRVGLMGREVTLGFLTMPTPFSKEFWMIEDDHGVPLARGGVSLTVAANVGFFEADLRRSESTEATQKLLAAIEKWASLRNAVRLVGPINFNTWFPYRFRCDKDPQYFAWEPNNPPEYVDLWRACGFTEIELYSSQCAELNPVLEGTAPAWKRFEDSGYMMSEITEETLLSRDMAPLYRMSMEAFRNNFLFEPIPQEAFIRLYIPLMKKKVDFSMSRIIRNTDGKEVAFSFSFLNGDAVVMKTLAVLDEARGRGLSNALMHLAVREGKAKGATKMVSALVRKGAQSESYARKAKLFWQHDYLLFSKEIGGK